MSVENAKRIYIVDEHPIVIKGVETMLRDSPEWIICGSATSFEDAINAVHDTKPDLLILDLIIQGSDGLRVLDSKNGRARSFSTLIYTIHNDLVFVERAMKLGASGFVLKHEPVENLMKAMSDVLNGNTYISPIISQQLYKSFANLKNTKFEDPLDTLSPKEKHILKLLGLGYRRKDIANTLLISAKTVDTHTDRIKMKLSINESSKLYMFAAKFYHLIN